MQIVLNEDMTCQMEKEEVKQRFWKWGFEQQDQYHLGDMLEMPVLAPPPQDVQSQKSVL